METREITRQAKQSLTIFKKQLHECQCKKNRLDEYQEKGWLTEERLRRERFKLLRKKKEYAKKYLKKYNKFVERAGDYSLPLECRDYAMQADRMLMFGGSRFIKHLTKSLLLAAALVLRGRETSRKVEDADFEEIKEKEREI